MNGWIIGYLVGAGVVAVVVTVLLLMIRGARRTADQAEAITTALQAARDGTAALWRVEDTVLTAERIVAAAGAARETLAGQDRS